MSLFDSNNRETAGNERREREIGNDMQQSSPSRQEPKMLLFTIEVTPFENPLNYPENAPESICAK